MSRVKLLIFDIDLTICDNFARKRKALERALGRPILSREWRRIRYRYGFREILKELQRDNSPLAIATVSKKVIRHFFYDADLFELDKPFKGAPETLNGLAGGGYTIAYITGRPIRETAEGFLRRHGFPKGTLLNERIMLGESHKKARLMKRLLRELKIPPEEAVAVGDLPGDAEAAREAGIMAICTTESKGFDKVALRNLCDITIKRITELPSALRRLSSGRYAS